MNIPYYRILEMNKIYEVFYDEENSVIWNIHIDNILYSY